MTRRSHSHVLYRSLEATGPVNKFTTTFLIYKRNCKFPIFHFVSLHFFVNLQNNCLYIYISFFKIALVNLHNGLVSWDTEHYFVNGVGFLDARLDRIQLNHQWQTFAARRR